MRSYGSDLSAHRTCPVESRSIRNFFIYGFNVYLYFVKYECNHSGFVLVTISKNTTRGGNTATGSATIGEKVGGVTVMKIPVNLTLSCDANGNLS